MCYLREYWDADIVIDSTCEDEPDTHYAIIHEFVHPVISEYGALVDTVFNLGHIHGTQHEFDTQWKVVEERRRTTDESVCTQVSRAIYELTADKLRK